MSREKNAPSLDALLHKIPPQELEAEQSVLGSVLIDNEAIGQIIDIIDPDDFYREGHQAIFRAMLNLYERREPTDLVTLTAELGKLQKLDLVGGLAYLSQLVDRIPTSAHVMAYAKIIKEKSVLRRLIRISTDIVGSAYQTTEEVPVLLDRAEREIFDIRDRKERQGFYSLRDIVKDNFKVLEELYEKKQSITGTSTHYADLDHMTSGFQAGDLIIIAGRPSMGKTSFAMNIAENVSIDGGKPVAVFSLEMSKEQLAQRLLCSQARVDSSNVRRGQVGSDDWMKITHAAGRISECPLFIDDTPAISPLEMRAKVRRLMRTHPVSLIVVDYLQLMRSTRKTDNREQEISDISRSLKALAKEMGVPVVALSQLNRSLESRKDRRPQLSDLRESGAIEQDADVIMFIYRDEVYNPDSPDKGMAEVIISKQRNGPIGTVRLAFINMYTRFENLSTTSGGFSSTFGA